MSKTHEIFEALEALEKERGISGAEFLESVKTGIVHGHEKLQRRGVQRQN